MLERIEAISLLYHRVALVLGTVKKGVCTLPPDVPSRLFELVLKRLLLVLRPSQKYARSATSTSISGVGVSRQNDGMSLKLVFSVKPATKVSPRS